MPVTKEIVIGYARTVSPKQYWPERFELSTRVELEPNDDEGQVVADYFAWIKSQVDDLANEAITRACG